MTFSYSPTIACCPHILILRACNYFMMPEVGVTPAFFMGQSSWADVLMFDKCLFLERQWPCQEKEWNTRGASQFLPGVCVCVHRCSCRARLANLKRHEKTQGDTGFWDWKSQGNDSGMGLFSQSLWGPMVIACQVLDKNLGYYITCFRNILVGWEGCSYSWPSCQGSAVAPVHLIPLWWGRLIRLANLVDPVVHRIFSPLSTFVVYLAKSTPPSLQVLTLSDTLSDYCTLTFNYNKSYYDHFLKTNPL